MVDVSRNQPPPGLSGSGSVRVAEVVRELASEIGYARSLHDGRFLWVDPGIQRMLGITAEDLTVDPSQWDARVEPADERADAGADDNGLGWFRWRNAEERILTVQDRYTVIDLEGEAVRVGVLRDVTDLVQAESHLAGERKRLDMILEGTRLGAWDWDMTTGRCTVDERWAAITGHTVAELSPATIERWQAMAHPEDQGELRDALRRHIDDELAFFDVEYRLQHRRGHWVWVHDRARVIEWSPDGQPVRMAGTTGDITRRHSSETAMREDVLLDPLTRLGNRRMLNAQLDELATAAQVEGTEFGIVMIDIDRFKAINDNLGHLRGDAVLKALATCIRGAIRPTDVAVRHAGDEFCVLLAESDSGVVRLVADRLLEHVRRSGIPGEADASLLSVSIGAAHSSEVATVDEESVFRLADERLYAAKRAGRDRVAASD